MSRSLTVVAGQTNVQAPDGNHYNAGQTFVLTDAQFAQVNSADIGPIFIDNGNVAEAGDNVITQGTHLAQVAALTSANAAGGTPTAAEHNAVVADLATLRTAVNALTTALEGTGKALA